MLITEIYETREDGVVLEINYSDNGKYIIQLGTGVKYIEAIDPKNMNRKYIESTEDYPVQEEITDEA